MTICKLGITIICNPFVPVYPEDSATRRVPEEDPCLRVCVVAGAAEHQDKATKVHAKDAGGVLRVVPEEGDDVSAGLPKQKQVSKGVARVAGGFRDSH